LERDFAGLSLDERLRERQAHSAPLVDALLSWVCDLRPHVRPSSRLGEALTYATNQADAMRVFLARGDVPLHNNLSELLLRQPVVGRKNWLFSRTEGGAEAACLYFSLIGSCMLQGVDPQAYLADVLAKLPRWPSNRVGELLPGAWRRAREAHPAL
jgi:transposase